MASGDTLLFVTPASSEPPSSNAATLDVRNVELVADYDASTGESLEWNCFMPRHYGGGGVTVTLIWMASTATSGAVVWDVAFKSFTDDADDLDTKAFAAVNSVTATTASASGEKDYATITFTDGADMDSVAAGEQFRLYVGRNAGSGSDTMAGDAELVGIEIKET